MTDGPPALPKPSSRFLSRLSKHPRTPTRELLQPYLSYEAWLRKAFARGDTALDNFANLVPVYDGHESSFKIRTIDRQTADPEKYLLPLRAHEREENGAMAITESLSDYKKNLKAFTHGILAGLGWSNVVVAGSAALLPLLSVRKGAEGGDVRVQKPLETYYQQIASASDIDIFLYGLASDDVAIRRILDLEAVIRKNQRLLPGTGLALRSKNAITLISPRWPYRHVQIILRLYKSISEILTGFDVDCACVAFDGTQVYSNPRGIAAIATRTNTIDLSRRSPSYENRLWKYRNHNFEVFWNSLDRSRIDEQRFSVDGSIEWYDPRFLTGLARLLFSEAILAKGTRRYRYGRTLRKMDDGGDSALSAPSGYATHEIPYSPRFNAQRVYEYVRRHSAEPYLFGTIKEVVLQGTKPSKKSKGIFAGKVTFIKDNPGRQMIGSFHPLTEDDWTEMAYVDSDEEENSAEEVEIIDDEEEVIDEGEEIIDKEEAIIDEGERGIDEKEGGSDEEEGGSGEKVASRAERHVRKDEKDGNGDGKDASGNEKGEGGVGKDVGEGGNE